MRILLIVVMVMASIGMSRADDLEQRVDALEGKMDRIIELLEKKTTQNENEGAGGAAAPAAASDQEDALKSQGETSPEVEQKTKLRNGAKLEAFLVTKSSWPTPQQGDAIVTIHDQGAAFNVGNFLATPASKAFEEHHVGVKWSGFLWIEEPGDYIFACGEIAGYSRLSICKVLINGQSVVTGDRNSRKAPALGRINFEKSGAYFVEIWLASYTSDTEKVYSLEYSKFGAPKMEKITPGTLYSKVE